MANKEKEFEILNPFYSVDSGIGDWANGIKAWAVENRESMPPLREVVNDLIVGIESAFHSTPQLIMLLIMTLIAWQSAGRKVAVVVLGCMTALGLLDPRAWDLAMTTMAVVLASVIICVIIGLPLGVLAGKNDRFNALIRPVLDLMQTIPAFVYLVPVVMLIGIGNVAGVIVTVVFALPPLVRLTSLGIRQVNKSVVEASNAFGSSAMQTLIKVELPLSLPSIMTGVNQTIMMALSVVVIASLISVKGLGNEVLRAMGRLDAGKAIVGGMGIVILAIVLDRISQGFGRSGRDIGHRHWWERGPVGACYKLYKILVNKNDKKITLT